MPNDQSAVFESRENRRVILATNVAETSLTIPGVRNVIDTGLARISRYNPRSKLLELPVTEVSQAAAKQRAGRCGREAPGVCIRLYDEQNFLQRDPYTQPEILRTSLASSILRCAALKLGKLADFPLPDTPSHRLLKDGVNLLREISALDKQEKITPIGRDLAKLPIDPRLGRFLLAAADAGQYDYALTICAAISVGDCRVRPVDKREAADARHAQFNHIDSDLLSYVNIWDEVRPALAALSRTQKKQYCQRNYLSLLRIRQWEDLRRQLHRQCVALRINTTSQALNYKKLHQAFLVGFASLIGVKNERGDYRGAHGVKFKIHPRSAVRGRKPKFVVCLERFETSARFADVVAKIEPSWVVKAAPHLIKSSYSRPVWDVRKGKAFIYETKRLFGIQLGNDRRVSYGTIDRAEARAMLIEHGLIKFELEELPDFLAQNRAAMDGVRRLEQKLRRQLIPGDSELTEYYQSRVPAHVTSIHALGQYLQQNSKAQDLLYRPSDELLVLQARAQSEYPDVIHYNEYEFNVSYRFEPASREDGVTVSVDKALLARLDDNAFESLCPGLLREKIITMSKSLPKAKRKKIAPIAEFAEQVLAQAGTESLHTTFCRCFAARSGEQLASTSSVKLDLPSHLIAHVAVLEQNTQNGREKRRFYASLQAAKAAELVAHEESRTDRDDTVFTHWQFDELPVSEETRIGKNRLVDYLAFVDVGTGVKIGHFVDMGEAAGAHRHGVARLASLASGVMARKSALPGFEQQQTLLMCTSLELSMEALQQPRKAAYAYLLGDEQATPRTMREFDAFMSNHGAAAEALAADWSNQLAELIAQAFRVQRRLTQELAGRWPEAYDDMLRQIRYLFSHSAFASLESQTLNDYQRYLSGIERRIERLALNPSKDAQKFAMVAPVVTTWHAKWGEVVVR